SGFVDTYLRLNSDETKVFLNEMDALGSKEREAVMEIVTSWMEEGIKRGVKEGREQGRKEGREEGLKEGIQQGRRMEAINLVLRHLTRRVGQLEENLVGQVKSLSLVQLEALSEALLDFSTRADLETWLADHSTEQ
ncbi:MAG TPA: DUF4351 domain-containing protein, partial [Candidatus Obscuribacterales bacterium]